MEKHIIRKIAGISGMAAQLVYTIMWILGGILQPDYSHIRDDVSTLMATGAPNKLLFDVMNISSTILGVIFYIGLLVIFTKQDYPILGPILLTILGIVGILVSFFFSLDEGGEMISFSAKMHFILVMCMPVLIMSAALSLWRGMKNVPTWVKFSKYSLISFFFILVLGLVGVFSIGTDLMGLGERLAILSTQQFFFGIALSLLREGKSAKQGDY